jgi:hypothetical protein
VVIACDKPRPMKLEDIDYNDFTIIDGTNPPKELNFNLETKG